MSRYGWAEIRFLQMTQLLPGRIFRFVARGRFEVGCPGVAPWQAGSFRKVLHKNVAGACLARKHVAQFHQHATADRMTAPIEVGCGPGFSAGAAAGGAIVGAPLR